VAHGTNWKSEDGQHEAFPSPLPLAKMDGFLHLPSNSRLRSPGRKSGEPSARQAVFLDRDGVLVEDMNFITKPDQLNVLPGVTEAIRMLGERFFIIVVTNQSGIGRGLMTEEDLVAVHTELVQRLAAENASVDALYYCPHHPVYGKGPYGIYCQCRKPGPGMLTQAARDWDLELTGSFMVGDRHTDIFAADAAGVTGIFMRGPIEEPGTAPIVVGNLVEAASMTLTLNETSARL